MKIRCNDDILDLDAINEYKPDGEHIFAQVGVFAYSEAEGDHSKSSRQVYVKNEDNGIVYFSDIAFKMLVDLMARRDYGFSKHFYKELLRGDGFLMEYKRFVNMELDQNNPYLAEMFQQMGLHDISLMNPVKVLKFNFNKMLLDAPLRGDMIYKSPHCILFDYLRLDGKTVLFELHQGLTELLQSMYPDEICDFVKIFYETLDKEDHLCYDNNRSTGAAPAVSGRTGDADGAESFNENDDDDADNENAESSGETRSDSAVNSNQAINTGTQTTALSLVSASDITGKDSTYGVQYCENLYNQELEHSDSDGNLDALVKSRANGTAAPIDVLSEMIVQEHQGDTLAKNLRDSVSDLKSEVLQAAAKANA